MATTGHLLIADDEEIFLLATADLLRRAGFTVDTATNAMEAQELLGSTRYDVMVSDIRMPGNPGLELLQDIPAPNTGLPVILVTGYPSMTTALQAMGCSVLAYLLKPLDFQELLNHVQRGVGLRRVQGLALEAAQRHQGWADALRTLGADLRSGPASLANMPLNELMGLMLGNLAASSMDLKQLLEISLQMGASPATCGVETCPRLGRMEATIRAGVATLEHTKGAFKSKELAEMRKSFEALLEAPSG